jgi:RimJ/RimL family protein N-acetyltransferase
VVIGDCGLIPIPFSGQGGKRGPDIELGYRLGAAHWGRGYATEAARAVLKFGIEDLGLDRIVAVTHPENHASKRVLVKTGFSDRGLTDRYYDHMTHLFEYVSVRAPGE